MVRRWPTSGMFLACGLFAGFVEMVRDAAESAESEAVDQKPNIVFILADDLGWGDVQCNNPEGKIPTPNIDRLAREGMRFTDAHSGSAVCTPTRYGIMTGRYSWRTQLQSGVLLGFNPPLIAPERLTVPALLRQHGYHTAGVGKWHLGMVIPSQPVELEVKEGPTTRGFDYFFGISASLDMPPFAFIENDRFTQLPTATKKWVREGPAAPDFEAIDVLPALAEKASEYLGARASEKRPFFLYLPLTSPHTPLVPTQEWQGKSELGEYGDFVMQTDGVVGRVLEALERHGLVENTLVICTSDNGCAPYIGVAELEKQGHFASGRYRGYKADIFEGGHRVPFVARWPARVQSGTTTDQITCLTDLMATCAEILGVKLPDDAGEDSVSILPVLLGKAKEPVREAIVHHSINGSFAIRQGKWKLELCPDSGGWSEPKPKTDQARGLPPVQLYDLSADVGERQNLQAEHPEVVGAVEEAAGEICGRGRSTPGRPQANDVTVKLP